ncbi:hypothetical protein [Micromonospora sp. NPDC002717]|uniref:hypothetical protein n=1 Tax=Micromonospora sp. NPDC002717 TaxID=3154424 RepID=UPI00331DA834
MPLQRPGALHPEHQFVEAERKPEMQNLGAVDRGYPTGSELAATLHEVAARLDGLGDVPISPAAVMRQLQQEITRRRVDRRDGLRSS